ncbi:hypothetical protein MHU86_20652 [Fragilaria crotonensis]|nr:hypothetical protein MHU86_20652 [Fragilaria crotonensis]
MLELLTCKGLIATRGLAYLLETHWWNRAFAKIHDRFQTEDRFGSKFVYSVDTALQNFFDMITSAGELPDMVDENLLVDKAKKLMDKIEDGDTLTIALPAALSPTPKKAVRPTSAKGTEEPSTKRSKALGAATTLTRSALGVQKHHPSDAHTNRDPHPSWLVKEGVDFLSLFADRAPGTYRWPKSMDPRLPKKNKQPRAAPLCVRFQMMAQCTYGCKLAHVLAKNMTSPEFRQAESIMRHGRSTHQPHPSPRQDIDGIGQARHCHSALPSCMFSQHVAITNSPLLGFPPVAPPGGQTPCKYGGLHRPNPPLPTPGLPPGTGVLHQR